jgi:HSP20 family protein
MEAKERERKKKRAVHPWQPFGEMAGWKRDMEKWPPWDSLRLTERASGVAVPAVDLYEENNEIVAKAELPGMEKADIQVSISDHLLTIKGEKKKEEEIKEEDYYRSERSCGSFVRNVELPKEVQAETARASFKNGILELRLPKREESKKKEVRVKVE